MSSKNKQILFLRSAPYDYHVREGHSLYEDLDEEGKQTLQPSIRNLSLQRRVALEKFIATYKPTFCFSSPCSRSKQTALLFGLSPQESSPFADVRFSMRDFSVPQDLPGNTFDPQAIGRLRNKFAVALLEDRLQEPKAVLEDRIQRGIDTILSTDHESVLCFSHGFIMKLYEGFFRQFPERVSFDEVVRAHDWNQPTYGFLEGFSVSLIGGRSVIKPLIVCSDT